jgi:hypothetical protein
MVYADVVFVAFEELNGGVEVEKDAESPSRRRDTPHAVFDLLFEEDACYVRTVGDLQLSNQAGVSTYPISKRPNA